MRPKRQRADGELPDKRTWPKLPVELQEQILLFLLGYADEAEQARLRAKQTADAYPDAPNVRNQVIYWSNVVSAIKWLLYRVDKRQKYLAILKWGKEPEPCQPDSGPAPSSEAEQSAPASEHGTKRGENPTVGNTPGKSLPSSSRKRGTTRGKR